MKKTAILILLVFFFSSPNAQITKGNWLVGGSGSFERQQETLVGADITSTRLQLYPNVGYFFINKFAAGLKPYLDFNRFNTNGNISKGTAIAFGPFLRYYFFPDDNQVNLFSEADYQHTFFSQGSDQNLLLFSAGPVVYFNSSVGLELTLNYEITHYINTVLSSKTLFLGIGFQIHLEKDK